MRCLLMNYRLCHRRPVNRCSKATTNLIEALASGETIIANADYIVHCALARVTCVLVELMSCVVASTSMVLCINEHARPMQALHAFASDGTGNVTPIPLRWCTFLWSIQILNSSGAPLSETPLQQQQ